MRCTEEIAEQRNLRYTHTHRQTAEIQTDNLIDKWRQTHMQAGREIGLGNSLKMSCCRKKV